MISHQNYFEPEPTLLLPPMVPPMYRANDYTLVVDLDKTLTYTEFTVRCIAVLTPKIKKNTTLTDQRQLITICKSLVGRTQKVFDPFLCFRIRTDPIQNSDYVGINFKLTAIN